VKRHELVAQMHTKAPPGPDRIVVARIRSGTEIYRDVDLEVVDVGEGPNGETVLWVEAREADQP
jgi:hypothetical protein